MLLLLFPLPLARSLHSSDERRFSDVLRGRKQSRDMQLRLLQDGQLSRVHLRCVHRCAPDSYRRRDESSPVVVAVDGTWHLCCNNSCYTLVVVTMMAVTIVVTSTVDPLVGANGNRLVVIFTVDTKLYFFQQRQVGHNCWCYFSGRVWMTI